MIFKMVPVLRRLARIARDHADEVVVVAYVRRQSDFLVSAFGQWLFRAPARIGLPAAFAAAVEQVRNPGFPPALIEGVCAAIEAGYAMPGPGEHTDFFDFMGTVSADGAGPNETFLAHLKDRVDTAIVPANAAFARQFSLPVSYFAPRRQVTQAQAQDEIWREGRVRAALPEALRQRERAARAALAQMAWAGYRGWEA